MNRRRISQKRLERLFEDLANGVIFQTVEDYREALRHLDINPKHEESLRMKEDCEEFFQSKWFRFLTLVDLKKEMMRMIALVEDKDQRLILELRYLCWKPWDEIEVRMNLSKSGVYYLKINALKSFEKIFLKNEIN